jgi:hypothetical protein
MKAYFQALGGAALLAMLLGCASQESGPVAGLDTSTPTPTCAKLLGEYASMQRKREQVQHQGEHTRTEFRMPMYFWPTVAGTFMSAPEAIATADHRLRQLSTAMEEQNCPLPQAS